MKKTWQGLFIVFFSLSLQFASAQTASKPASKTRQEAKPNAQQEVLAIEQARFEAMQKNDQTALRNVLADDLMYIHSNAKVDNKEQFLASMASGTMVYQSIQSEDRQVRVYEATAVVTGLAKIKAITDGQPIDIQVRFTDVYAKRKGHWQMVSWQSTRLPATK